MPFKFRAQAALDLRTRELEQAQRELARAQGDRDAARLRLEQADTGLADARRQGGEAMRTASDCTALQWYQSWILRLSHERKAHSAALAAREEAVTRAAAACTRAQQRREALDRFREKARLGYEARQAAVERKLIDELATRRYAATRQIGVVDENLKPAAGSGQPVENMASSAEWRRAAFTPLAQPTCTASSRLPAASYKGNREWLSTRSDRPPTRRPRRPKR